VVRVKPLSAKELESGREVVKHFESRPSGELADASAHRFDCVARGVIRLVKSLGSLLFVACLGLAAPGCSCEDVNAQIWGDTTCYPPGFSEDAFRKVRGGQSKARVRDLLGEPFDKNGKTAVAGEEYWYYSRSCSSDSYRMRIVVFQGDAVSEVIALYEGD
jgi:hypothetical protein